jgi:hypothetical protein
MTAAKKTEEKTTDDLQNGGKLTVEERLSALEKFVHTIIEKNCLLKPE